MSAQTLGAAWAAWILPAGLQAVLLVLLVGLLERPLRARGWSQLVHGLWLLVPLRLALPPALLASLPEASWAALPYSTPATSLVRSPAVSSLQAPLTVAAVCWALGVVVLAAATVTGQARARRRILARSREPGSAVRARSRRCAARLGLRRVPRLALSPDASVPAVIGMVRPVVVLPAGLERELGPEALDHVLLHELAHVRRRDLWADLPFLLARILYWPVPLLGHARRRARQARELSCDATVAACLDGGTRGYRRTLLALALRPATGTTAGAALLDDGHQALDRVRALERGPIRSLAARRLAAVFATVALFALLLPLDAGSRAGAGDPDADVMRARVEAALRGDSSLLLRNAVRGLHAVRSRDSAETTPERTHR